ncbi:MAG: hypothetical protein ACHQUA_02285 [Microgenomates group bacterium]
MEEEIKLRIKISTCENLNLDLERQEGKLAKVGLITPDKGVVTNVGYITNLYAQNSVCALTRHNCILSRYNGFTRRIEFEERERCPGFKPCQRDYIVKGDRIDNTIHEVYSIKRAE